MATSAHRRIGRSHCVPIQSTVERHRAGPEPVVRSTLGAVPGRHTPTTSRSGAAAPSRGVRGVLVPASRRWFSPVPTTAGRSPAGLSRPSQRACTRRISISPTGPTAQHVGRPRMPSRSMLAALAPTSSWLPAWMTPTRTTTDRTPDAHRLAGYADPALRDPQMRRRRRATEPLRCAYGGPGSAQGRRTERALPQPARPRLVGRRALSRIPAGERNGVPEAVRRGVLREQGARRPDRRVGHVRRETRRTT